MKVKEKMKVLRVDTFTNFNYTDKEFKQLEKIEQSNQDYKIFVNSNSFNELSGKYPIVVTINPHLTKFVEPKGDLDMVRAARIKYICDPKPEVKKAFEDAVAWCKSNRVPILITYMRFRKLETLKKYCRSKFNYIWAKNYFRQGIKKKWDDPNFHYCDAKEKGCPECMNCAKLTYFDSNAEVYSTNLSSSGMCKFNCPDCYVKTISQWHHGTICFDKINQNTKQKGKKDFKLYKYGQRQLTFDKYVEFKNKKQGGETNE